jgi:predicted nucleotidyltransferase
MSTKFLFQSSDPVLSEKANRVAQEFSQKYICDNVVGIVFLGAIARGYFDHSSDIDIAIFKKQASEILLTEKFTKIDDFEVQIWLSDYEHECMIPWDMPKRWTYSQGQIFFEQQDKISQLLLEKVPLKVEEKKWLMMSGLSLSEWYANRLTQLWLERGNIVSAHHMFDQGLNYFFDMLFGLNNELVPDMKWRYYIVEQLEQLPRNFQQRVQKIMLLHSFTIEELERRRDEFVEMWQEMQPIIEEEVQMTFKEMEQIV